MNRLLFFLRVQTLWTIQKRHKEYASTVNFPFERQHKTPLKHKYSKTPMPIYGGRHLVTMISGSGIGPELMIHVKDVFEHAKVPVDFEHIRIKSMKDVEHAIISVERNGAALKGNIESMSGEVAGGSPNVAIRQTLDLYLNIIHCKPYCNLPTAKHNDIDIVLVRQNTEGEYALLEHESVKGVVESLKIITKLNSERVAHRAFEFAAKHKRKKVTVVHKANIMKLADGLFLKRAKAVAKSFPSVKQDDMLIDNCTMQMVSNPKQFDILMMPNLYGSIVANIICGIVGGPGLYAGCNYGDYYAVFEPATRNMGTDIAGKNEANPVAMLNASVELLYYLGLQKHGSLLDMAIYKTVCKDMIHTPDLKGSNTSKDVVEKIKDNISFIRAAASKK